MEGITQPMLLRSHLHLESPTVMNSKDESPCRGREPAGRIGCDTPVCAHHTHRHLTQLRQSANHKSPQEQGSALAAQTQPLASKNQEFTHYCTNLKIIHSERQSYIQTDGQVNAYSSSYIATHSLMLAKGSSAYRTSEL